MDASFKVLKAAIDAGHVDPRCSIGHKVTTEHRPGTPQGDLYRAKSREDATKFRLEWAQKRFDLMQQGKYFKQKWQRVGRKEGQYMSFSKLVKTDGDDFPSLVGALKCAQVCPDGTTMGPSASTDREARVPSPVLRVGRRVRAVLERLHNRGQPHDPCREDGGPEPRGEHREHA